MDLHSAELNVCFPAPTVSSLAYMAYLGWMAMFGFCLECLIYCLHRQLLAFSDRNQNNHLAQQPQPIANWLPYIIRFASPKNGSNSTFSSQIHMFLTGVLTNEDD